MCNPSSQPSFLPLHCRFSFCTESQCPRIKHYGKSSRHQRGRRPNCLGERHSRNLSTHHRWRKSWRAAQVPGAESLDFRDVEAFGANLAYLLSAGPGEQSRIYKTIDAGKNWALQFTNKNPKGFFDCMAFWDRDHGIAVGDPVPDNSGKLRFELIATEDGGENWKAIPPDQLPPAVEGEGAFAASGTCITVQGSSNVWFASGGKVARVFRSADAGKTWSVADTPIVHGPDSAGIFSIAFRDAIHGVIAGGDYKHPEQDGPNLALTDDGASPGSCPLFRRSGIFPPSLLLSPAPEAQPF